MPRDASNQSEWLRKAASVLGASGVALGAIGAHALKDTLSKRNSLANWQTATIYQLFHSVALLGLAAQGDAIRPVAGQLMALGTAMFSGSIYCLCLGIGPKPIMGPTTPVGGLLMIGGWIAVGIGKSSSDTSSKSA